MTRWYRYLTLNRMARLYLGTEEVLEGKKLPPKREQEVKKMLSQFNKLRKKYLWITLFKAVCLVFIYVSLISFFTENLLFLGFVTEQVRFITGVVGIPIFIVLMYFFEKTANVIVVDGQLYATRIIALAEKHTKK